MVRQDAGEIVLPVDGANGEKEIDVADFAEKVQRVLHEKRYRAAARSVAQRMQQFGGAQDAADRIELLAHGKV